MARGCEKGRNESLRHRRHLGLSAHERNSEINFEACVAATAAFNPVNRAYVARALSVPGLLDSDREALERFRVRLEQPQACLPRREHQAVKAVLAAYLGAHERGETVTEPIFKPFDAAKTGLAPFLRGDLSALPKAPPGRASR